MLENVWTDYLLQPLIERRAQFDPPPYEYPPLRGQWIALSVLQKAIRRGDALQALRAASYLHRLDYRILWRRLVVIGWEDIGLGNPDLCFTTTAAAGSKRWREANGGDWAYAAYLTTAMCRSIKDRTTDDLMMIALHDPLYETQRNAYYDLQFGSLLEIVHNTDARLATRIIAAWYLAGTQSYSFEGLRRRKGDVQRYFASIDPELCPEHVTSLCRIGVSRSRTVLPVFVPTFWRNYEQADLLPFVADAEILDHSLADIPRYAFDGFTRSGRRYLKRIARAHSGLRDFLAQVAPPPERDELVREMYFRIESSLCDKRLDWDVGSAARRRADEVGFGLQPEVFNAGKIILRQALNEMPMTEAEL